MNKISLLAVVVTFSAVVPVFVMIWFSCDRSSGLYKAFVHSEDTSGVQTFGLMHGPRGQARKIGAWTSFFSDGQIRDVIIYDPKDESVIGLQAQWKADGTLSIVQQRSRKDAFFYVDFYGNGAIATIQSKNASGGIMRIQFDEEGQIVRRLSTPGD